MPNIINIESKQHKKEHFVYIDGKKIAVYPLGPDMSQYENTPDVTIFALRGWYYIPLEDKEQEDARRTGQSQKTQHADSNQLKPRGTSLGF